MPPYEKHSHTANPAWEWSASTSQLRRVSPSDPEAQETRCDCSRSGAREHGSPPRPPSPQQCKSSQKITRQFSKSLSGRLIHVSSLPVMIPSSHSLLSRDERLPLDSWNQSKVQENVFGNQFSTCDSPRDHPQRIQSDDVQGNQEAVP